MCLRMNNALYVFFRSEKTKHFLCGSYKYGQCMKPMTETAHTTEEKVKEVSFK